jgi:hypothetical protein
LASSVSLRSAFAGALDDCSSFGTHHVLEFLQLRFTFAVLFPSWELLSFESLARVAPVREYETKAVCPFSEPREPARRRRVRASWLAEKRSNYSSFGVNGMAYPRPLVWLRKCINYNYLQLIVRNRAARSTTWGKEETHVHHRHHH